MTVLNVPGSDLWTHRPTSWYEQTQKKVVKIERPHTGTCIGRVEGRGVTSELLSPLQGRARVERFILLPTISCQKSPLLLLAKVSFINFGKSHLGYFWKSHFRRFWQEAKETMTTVSTMPLEVDGFLCLNLLVGA